MKTHEQHTTATPLTVEETRAKLAAATKKRDSLKIAPTKEPKWPTPVPIRRVADAPRGIDAVNEAERKAALAKAELEVLDATAAHQDALLADELAGGDPIATKATEWLPTIVATVQELVELDLKKREVIARYEALAALRPFNPLVAQRRAAGEPDPLVPPDFAPRAIYTLHAAPYANPIAAFSPEGYARIELRCEAAPETELGHTFDERLAAMLEGRGNRIVKRDEQKKAIQRAELAAREARFQLHQQYLREQEEAARRRNEDENKGRSDRYWASIVATDRQEVEQRRAKIADKQKAADAYVASLRSGS